jgi:hypothetical protein
VVLANTIKITVGLGWLEILCRETGMFREGVVGICIEYFAGVLERMGGAGMYVVLDVLDIFSC